MGIDLSIIYKNCKKFWESVFAQNGLVKNPDGTISVFVMNDNGVTAPTQVSKQCCEILKEIKNEDYYFDLDTQKCRWSKESAVGCVDNKPFKIVLNPKGNDGTIFYFENDEKCSLVVDFDYLFKLDCDTLSNSLTQIKPVDPRLLAQITEAQAALDNQKVKCEELNSQLTYLINQFNATRYSISCDHFPLGPINVLDPLPTSDILIEPSPKQRAPFNKTGFGGGLAPFSFPKMKYGPVNFCLTEPDGLNTWADLLGPNRYQQFLNGDPTSYSCLDVIAIYNRNQEILGSSTVSPVLIEECTTPFGTKSDVKKEIDVVTSNITKCEQILADLQAKLDALLAQETALLGDCNSPVGLMETLDVSMSIDIVGEDGSLTAATTQNFFPAIGIGNLYNYLVAHPDNSGFYICGEPSPNETWANGCTPLYFSELSGQVSPDTNTVDEPNVSACLKVRDYILQELFKESELSSQTNGVETFNQSLSPTIMSSVWLHYSTVINDVDVINMIANKKIKLSLNINSSCGNFCVLVDKIALTKECVDVNGTNIFVSQSPGFNLTRVIDNKKSWLNNTTLTNREFDIKNAKSLNPIRLTDYDVLDERLVINSKEIDLDINIAGAVEHDVWCYISDNPCLLTGVTYCDPCVTCGNKQYQDDECFNFQDSYVYEFMDGVYIDTANSLSSCCGDDRIDFTELLTTDISTIKTLEGFENTLLSELINVKNRQTISGYPTLKALYERYLRSNNYCDTTSSAFDYYSMDQFADLIGDYWVDLIEQVIPATTIWGSVKIYTNTIFDQQKFKYKTHSSLFGGNPFQCLNVLSPINGVSGQCQTVEVISTVITTPKEGELASKPVYNYTDKVCIAQMNWGSEFIGTVSTGDGDVQFPYGDLCNPEMIPECTSPMNYIINYLSGVDFINNALTDGIIIPNCDFCCNDCEPYVLCSASALLYVLTDITCCLNYIADNETTDLLQTQFGDRIPTPQVDPTFGFNYGIGCEESGFETCLDTLPTVFDSFDAIVSTGLIEHGTLNGKSQLCELVTVLSQYDPVEVNTIMGNLLKTGLVITCSGNEMRIMSIEAYNANFK